MNEPYKSLNDADSYSVYETLIQTVQDAEAEYANRRTTLIIDFDKI